MKVILIVVSVLTMIGCSVSKEPPSPIVQKAESCGAGSLAEASAVAVQDRFGKHRDCAVAVSAAASARAWACSVRACSRPTTTAEIARLMVAAKNNPAAPVTSAR